MTVIRGRQLTTFDVSPDGASFAIHVTDEQARPASLVLPAECLGRSMSEPKGTRSGGGG